MPVGPTVVVFPLSGYVNRLQAIASSALLADDLGGALLVCWETSDVAPAPADAVFSGDFVARHVVSAEEVRDRFAVARDSLPNYLASEANRVTLAGYDRGEQHFMPSLRTTLADRPGTDLIVLAAGGKFLLEGGSELSSADERAFRGRRHAFYGALPLHEEIEGRVRDVTADRDPFLGLHLRYSDRSHQAPARRSIGRSLEGLAAATRHTSVFIASDASVERDRWRSRASSLGLAPWTAEAGSYPRSDPRSMQGALVDWRILGQAAAMVYFAESSFAEEACVAGDGFETSIALQPSPTQTALVRAREYSTAALTYPRRHGWPGARG